jgi:hypothetical protein
LGGDLFEGSAGEEHSFDLGAANRGGARTLTASPPRERRPHATPRGGEGFLDVVHLLTNVRYLLATSKYDDGDCRGRCLTELTPAFCGDAKIAKTQRSQRKSKQRIDFELSPLKNLLLDVGPGAKSSRTQHGGF